ncbi:FKBP-type peptidyl-prolyl cis-trans isomerase [Halospeciosus flavus]|uniref:peptidylprolyl isomerase n=1 Tax=Halospeciosus flavus TaxID=3032283 RepID=A0ABD5Z1U0_9EURY|nr:FKBP-type peptidyl-prolyl cis-trans isomerase [Halospeciosus flavus]
MSDEHEAEQADETDVEEDVESETEAAETEGLQEGDFVKVAYTARTVEGGELVDTTDEEVAEEEDVDTEEHDFSPRTIVLGEGHIFDPVEEDMIGKEVGDEGSVVVPAEEAFGEYDEEQVRTVKAEKIPEDNRYPGAHVDIDGEHGHVETIVGGRARVDFNHPLAGEDIEYEYEILEEVEDRVEKAQGLLQMYFDVELDMHIETDEVEEEVTVEPEEEGEEPETETETVEKETLYIEQSPQLQFNQQWMMGKQQILQQVMDQIDVDRVIVQEVIEGGQMGMPGMMGGMGGMGGAPGGAEGEEMDIEAALEEADVDADEIAEELEGEEL